MGSEAGCRFYLNLIRMTPARRDQDHLPVILYSQPQIPDRSEFIINQGPSPVPRLQAAVRKLQDWGADFIAVPCNTAHCFHPQMQSAVTIPILHIVEETVAAVKQQVSSHLAPIGLLATRATLRTGLYQQAMEPAGLLPVVPALEQRKLLHQAILSIKAGRRQQPAQTIQQVMKALSDSGVEAMIFGCTELRLLSGLLNPPCRVFDSVDLLAQETIRLALCQDYKPESLPA